MLINNFGDLKAVLSRYMFQQRFTPDYDLATANFEKAANRRLRVLPMEAVTNLTTIGRQVALPPDYILWRTVLRTPPVPSEELDYVHPAFLTTTASDKKLFTIENLTFKTNPTDDTADAYEFHYYQKIPTITTSDLTSNWLLAEHPDVYEYGALFELFALGRNIEVATLYRQRRDEVLTEIIQRYALTTGAPSSSVRQSPEYF